MSGLKTATTTRPAATPPDHQGQGAKSHTDPAGWTEQKVDPSAHQQGKGEGSPGREAGTLASDTSACRRTRPPDDRAGSPMTSTLRQGGQEAIAVIEGRATGFGAVAGQRHDAFGSWI